MRRVEPGGKEYKFASASKGAKVLAVNNETHLTSCEKTGISTFAIHFQLKENLWSENESFFAPEESTEDPKAVAPQVKHSRMDGLYQNLVKEDDPQSVFDESTLKHDASGNDIGDQVGDLRHQPVGRMPGDSVLKILMQKARSLDLHLSVLERYLEGLKSRHGSIFTDFEKEIAQKNALLRRMRSD
ncbi:Galactose-binding domain-like [Melia azedarach]|uniref:Galactose-binding domain-like n=1 Tax=Melia azedarach TaxID=155640 RepID=A0ACC1XWF8_MELAZ|nr:Galactose-binding domain-like [Melia azedarach]